MYLLPISTSCTLFLNKILFYSPNHDNTSLYCSTSIHHGTSIHSPRRWRLLHSEATTRLLHNRTSIHTPRRWDTPTQRQQQDFSAAGISPTWRNVCNCSTSIHHGTSIHSPRRWRLPHSKAAIRLLQNRTSIHMPRRWDISHSEAAIRFLRNWDFPHSGKCLNVR